MSVPSSDTDAASARRVVGVDIGGTKTHLMSAPVRSSDASQVRQAVVPSSSWRGPLGDFRADSDGLRDLLVDRFGDAVLQTPLAVGAHGCDNTDQCQALRQALQRHFAAPVVVVNDSELMVPAMGIDQAIGVVVGTGAIATARSEGGELLTAGGWGWLLGDDGSAPALVREATRAVLSHLDQGGSPDALSQRLMSCFHARNGAELALAVTDTASAESWGQHAPEVFESADEGSQLADDVVRTAGERIAGLIDRLLRRGIRAGAVVAGGSVIERQPRLQDALRAALARDRPGVDLHILTKSPVVGAIALARRAAHHATLTPLRTESSIT